MEDFSDLSEENSIAFTQTENAELLQIAAAKFEARIRPNNLDLKSFAKLAVNQWRLKNEVKFSNSVLFHFQTVEEKVDCQKTSAHKPLKTETVEAGKNSTVSKLIN